MARAKVCSLMLFGLGFLLQLRGGVWSGRVVVAEVGEERLVELSAPVGIEVAIVRTTLAGTDLCARRVELPRSAQVWVVGSKRTVCRS